MFIDAGNILLVGSILLLLSVIAGKTSSKFGVPTLIFFLIVGVLAGSEGIGGIHFDNAGTAQFIGIVALNFILFSGGLDTDWQKVKHVVWRGVSLSTIGVLVTAFTVGLFVHFVFGFSLLTGVLLGSVVSATDAAAVFSILRSRGVKLKGSLGPVLELESGSNDPMAYFLTISLTSLITSGETSGLELFVLFLREFILGAAVGLGMGKLSHWLINKIKLDSEGLYPVLVLGLALFTYSATHFIGGNGFLAIYLSAIILGNSSFIHKRSLIRFYEGQAWLMQIILFLTLGLLVFPSKILPVVGMGLFISAFLIFVARPLGVFISLAFFKTSLQTRLFISWVGLRGGVPIVFATYPLIAGVAGSDLIFNLVFFISVTSVLLQGTTLPAVARLLKVTRPRKHETAVVTASGEQVRTIQKELEVPSSSTIVGKKIVTLNLPASLYIVSIQRKGHYFQPIGSTKIEAGDILQMMADDERALQFIYPFLNKHHE
ncbi:MAG TPA: potassium/proton antiporter [Flavisolibacter sp.]|jgi:cell volume regulation protein A|nr:potassium/proton antiporter [Flavisolibacter sp.]